MPFDAVVHQPVYRQVAAQIRGAILDGELEAGQALPSERQLCDRFAVGRTTVREALRALQAQGLVVSDGATSPLRVSSAEALSTGPLPDALDALLRLGHVPVADLVALREALEGAAIAALATRRDPVDLAPAEQALVAMERAADDVEAFEAADVRFHLALATASGNTAIPLVMTAVRAAISVHLSAALRALPDPGAVTSRLRAEHAAILDAVRAHDAERAQQLLRSHIRGLYRPEDVR